jgi:uncharacterized membrane protein HdeD (DUF308 family)
MSEATIPSERSGLPHDLIEKIENSRTTLLWIGIALVVVGILAILFPVFTTVTATLMIGWVLILAGLVSFFGALSIEGTGPFFGELLLSLLKLALGVYLLRHPGVGIVIITLVLAVMFMIDGAVRIGFAIEMRRRGGWFWMILSALVSIVAGLLIATGLPESSLFVLGLLVGINFLGTGISLIMLSRQSPARTLEAMSR